MGIISVLLFLLLGGLFGGAPGPDSEPVFDDPLADEFYAFHAMDTGYCYGYGPKKLQWRCVDRKLRNFDQVLVAEDQSDPLATRFTVSHFVIRPGGSVTLYTETWEDETVKWSRTECPTQATIRETVQTCR